ncbi:MAG: DUF29 domain-containing protein [Microcystis aeruginosa F13-15]|nr:DUF29 domain-containing protein [Microcystis aeruginosa F13-15]
MATTLRIKEIKNDCYSRLKNSLRNLSFKDQLKRYLTTNLRKYLEQEFDNIYEDAVRYVRQKTDNQVNFPDTCPYSLAELLDPNWLPPYE